MNLKEYKSVYIYNPSLRTGGTNNLLNNLIETILSTELYRVFIIDYIDGKSISKFKKNKLVYHLNVDSKIIKIEEGVFISILLHVKLIQRGNFVFGNNVRGIFWSTHPEDGRKLIPISNIFFNFKSIKFQILLSKILSKSYHNKISAFFNLGNKNYGIIYMDKDNLKPNKEFFRINGNHIIWPLTTELPKLQKNDYSQILTNKITVTFLNRLVDFKYYPTISLIKQLEDTGLKFHFVIIGDGPYKKKLLKELTKVSNITYEYLGLVEKSELDKLLLKSDFSVGMATSALESSKLKIPTLALPFFKEKKKHDTIFYKWVSEINDIEIVDYDYSNSQNFNNNYNLYLENLRNNILSKGMRNQIGVQCYNQWANIFSNDKLLLNFQYTLANNKFYLNENTLKLLKRPFHVRFIDKLKSLLFNLKLF